MSSQRTAVLPFEHLCAEMASYPFGSEAAFRLRVTGVLPSLGHGAPRVDDDGYAEQTRRLWRRAEAEIRVTAPGASIDQLVDLRDRFWFPRPLRERYELEDLLGHLATMYLERRGAVARPRAPFSRDARLRLRDSGRSDSGRIAWRWLTFALPADLLLAALPGGAPAPISVEAIDPVLARRLEDSGFAEPHLHLGAAIEFPALWVSTMHGQADSTVTPRDHASPGAVFDGGRRLPAWLIRCALARIALAAYLAGSRSAPFGRFLRRRLLPAIARRFGGTFALALSTGLSELAAGALTPRSAEPIPSGPDSAMLRKLYALITGLGSRPIREPLARLGMADPVSRYLLHPRTSGAIGPELTLVHQGLAHLRRSPDDFGFRRLFWQAIRVRVLYYRHVVQRPMTNGLQWFMRSYARVWPGRSHLSTRHLIESAARVSGMGRGLRALEIRTSPDTSMRGLRGFVEKVVDQTRRFEQESGAPSTRRANGDHPLEVGVVLHFTKDRAGGAREGAPAHRGSQSNEDPRSAANFSGYRFGGYYQAQRRGAQSFGNLLQTFPETLGVLRGIDVAADERGVPNWVLRPLFRFVRDSARHAARDAVFDWARPYELLRTSVHAGEDFVHLMGGLRRIEEGIRYFGLREGDRLGHALALGVDPARWAQSTGRFAVTCQQRLANAVWELRWHSHRQTKVRSSRLKMLRDEVARLSVAMFGTELSEQDLRRFVDDLYSEPKLRRVRFPRGPTPLRAEVSDWNRSERILLAYLCDEQTFRRGRQIEWIDPEQEIEALEIIQDGLRCEVAKRGLSVEVNPSSNLLIGGLGDLSVHPVWRMSPPIPNPDLRPVSVSLGSDDPVVFATDLRTEYGLIEDALVRSGLSTTEARSWLDRARQAGLDGRFTAPRLTGLDIRRFHASYPASSVRPLL